MPDQAAGVSSAANVAAGTASLAHSEQPATVEVVRSTADSLTQDSELKVQLAEAQSQIEALQRQLAGVPAQHDDSQLTADLAASQSRIAALQSELADLKSAVHALPAEQAGNSRSSRDATARLRDESGSVSRSASPGREQGELRRQVNTLQSRLQQLQSERDHMASALLRLAEVPHDTDAAIAKLEHQHHQARQHESFAAAEAPAVPEGRTRELRQYDADLASAQAQANASLQQLNALRDQLESQQAQHAEQQAALAASLKMAQHAQQEQQALHKAEFDAAGMQHRTQIASLSSNSHAQSVEIASLQNSVFSAYSEVKTARESLDAAVKQHEAGVSSLKAQHDAAEAEHATQLSAIQQEVQTTQTDHTAEVARLQEAVAAAQSQGQHARDDVIISLQGQLESQRAQHQAAVQKLNEQLKSEVQRHQGMIAALELSLEAQRAQHDSAQTAMSEAQRNERQQHEQALAALNTELQQQQQRHTAELSSMDVQFRSQADEFQNDSESRLESLTVSHEQKLSEMTQQQQHEVANQSTSQY